MHPHCPSATFGGTRDPTGEKTSMEYIDPVEVSPNEYKLLYEDDDIRVVDMNLPAGVSDTEHSHPNEVVYFITGGKARIHVGDESMEVEVPNGHVMVHDPWTHRVENIGDTDIHAIIVEKKKD